MSMKVVWSNVSFKTCVSVLIFFLDNLSIDINGVFLSPPLLITLLLISPLMTVNICLIYWGDAILSSYIFTIVIPSSWINPLNVYIVSFFVSFVYFEVVSFVWEKYCYSSYLLIYICTEYLFPSPHFQSVCVPRCEVVSCRYHVYGSCFCIHSPLFLLVRALNPFNV